MINKIDLEHDWRIDDAALGDLRRQGAPVIATSARTGLGVEDAFETLVRAMVAG